MADTIYYARLPNLAEVVAHLPVAKTAYMLLERIPMTWLDEQERRNGLCFERYDPTAEFDLWERGRVFDASFEFRWERVDNAFQSVYCGANAQLPGFQRAEELDLAELRAETRSYFLWGSKVREEDLPVIGQAAEAQVFVELQIPRLIHYPVSAQAQRVKLQVCEYRDRSGNLVFHRFQGVEEIP